jgi:NADPH-dependent glutamate synthase beta subunit-like oxidoreductase
MLSTDEEIIEGCDEGITLYNSQSFIRITETGGKVTGVECQKVTSFNFDDEGRLEVECEEDSNHVIPADTVIFAVGQRPEVPDGFGLSTKPNSTIEVEWDDVSTAIEGVFAAGDAVTGTSSVIKAIASGRQAAEAIDSFLGGEGNIDEKLAPTTEPSAWLGTGEGFACLERVKTDASPGTSRTADFNCINETYNEEDATKEAERCLQCDLRLKISKVKFWVDY